MASLEEFNRGWAEAAGREYQPTQAPASSTSLEEFNAGWREATASHQQRSIETTQQAVWGNGFAGIAQSMRKRAEAIKQAQVDFQRVDPTMGARLQAGGFAGQVADRAFGVSQRQGQVPMEVPKFGRPSKDQIALYGEYTQNDDGTWVPVRSLAGGPEAQLTATPELPGLAKHFPTDDKIQDYLEQRGTLGRALGRGLNSSAETAQSSMDSFASVFDFEELKKAEKRGGLLPVLVDASRQLADPDPAKTVADAATVSMATMSLVPQWLLFSGASEAGEELPLIGKGFEAVNKGFEVVGAKGGETAVKGVNILPISESAKEVLRGPAEGLGAIAAQLGVGVLTGMGVGKKTTTLRETTKTKSKEALGDLMPGRNDFEDPKTAIEKVREYNDELTKQVAKSQKEGREITPGLAEVINNVVAKKVDIRTPETVMSVPAPSGAIRVGTTQQMTLQSMLKGRENFNYKKVETLGDGSDGNAIQAKFEWDPETQQATILTTNKAVADNLSHELGYFLDVNTTQKIYKNMGGLMPDYFKKTPQANGGLAAYVVGSMNGDVTVKQINKKIDTLATNFRVDMEKLSDGKTLNEKYREAVVKVINSPEKSREIAPEFTSFIRYALDEAGYVANAVQRKAIEVGVSPVMLQKGKRAVATEKVIANLEEVRQNAIKAAQKPEAKKEFYESKDTPDVEGVAVKETPAVEKKGVAEKETWLTKEAKGTKTVEEFERNIKSVYGKALASESPQAKSLVNDIEQIDDLGEFYKQATQKPVVKKATKAPVTSKKTKEASTTAKTTKKAAEAKSEPKKATSEQKKTKEEGPDWIWGKEGGPKKKAEKKLVEGQRKSKMVERLNKELPDGMKLDEIYDVKHRNDQLDTAAKLIEKDKAEAIQKAYNPKTDVDQREALLIELGEVAKKNNDFVAVRDLFMERSAMLRQSGRAIDLEKAAILLNPHEKYMRDVVNARLHKVKVTAEDINNATKAKAKGEKVDVKIKNTRKQITEKTRKSFKIKDAQEIFDQLTC